MGADLRGYVLWVGCCLFDHDTMLRRPGVNPAGRRWQKAMVTALQAQGQDMRSLIHAPEPIWPRGRIWESGKEPLDPEIEGDAVAFLNLPFLRPLSLRTSYLRGFKRVRERHGDPALVLSFNAYPYNVSVGRRAEAAGIPWVCIVADVPESKRARKRHDRSLEAASGRVFLSWSEYSSSSHPRPKLHLDGGVAGLRGAEGGEEPETEEPPVVLYTGSLGHWGGVDFLLESFRHVRHEDAELWICGHGRKPAVQRVRQAAAEDRRVNFLGLVSEDRLQEVSERATLFVNPRPSHLPMNAGNFPSKVLEYLSYGKPVVSTWTGGLAPQYRDVLVVPERETPEELAAALDDVLSWGHERRRQESIRIRSFLNSEKLWGDQSRRLLAWLKAEVFGADTGP